MLHAYESYRMIQNHVILLLSCCKFIHKTRRKRLKTAIFYNNRTKNPIKLFLKCEKAVKFDLIIYMSDIENSHKW